MSASIIHKNKVQLSEPKIQLNNSNGKMDYKKIIQQNRIIKKQNEVFKRELDLLSEKLDAQIKKKMSDRKGKPWSINSNSAYLQLNNAQKKCQIYKRESNFYKKKLDHLSVDQQKSQQKDWKVEQLKRQNEKLIGELKNVQKIVKWQERGLQEMGSQGYLKVIDEKLKLHEEVKRLNKLLDEYRRGVHSIEEQEEQQGSTNNRYVNSSFINTNRNTSNTKERSSMKQRIKSQQSNVVDSNELTLLQERDHKNYLRIKRLTADKNKMHEQLGHCKEQLAEKDKQINSLKEKIQNLRKNNQVISAQLENQRDKNDNFKKEGSKANQDRDKLYKPNYRVWRKSSIQSVNNTKDLSPERSLRNDEKNDTISKTIKWNHQNYASKIVQIQVLIHQMGHIKDIHVRYKKGEPKRNKWAIISNNLLCLKCKDGEYIKHISGCFSDGYLQCLSLITSDQHSKVFGNSFLLEGGEESQKFEFLIDSKEFPGALYGENDEEGVKKLGCLILKQ